MSGGGLVVGPEPSKLMARVQIPVAAFCCEHKREQQMLYRGI